ncbi:MAG: HEAT repeat domain-containing protein [bacterium]
MLNSTLNIALVAAPEQEAELIAVLKSKDADIKEKFDACRILSRVGTKEAVAPLAELLGDETYSHMARYGLETIPDPAVDDALRDALGKVTGLPRVGVIGSIGVRRDPKAVPALAGLLQSKCCVTVQAAAQTLGSIGTAEAAKALGDALESVAPANQLAFCEGLFRCAEALAASGQKEPAIAIYDRLYAVQGPQQVHAGALRGAVLTRGIDGLPLLKKAIQSDDFGMVQAAARTAQEMPEPEVTKALKDMLGDLSADKQILLKQTLAQRAGAARAVKTRKKR